jgi:hypothetical protein
VSEYKQGPQLIDQTMLPSEEGEIARLNAICSAQQKLISDLTGAGKGVLFAWAEGAEDLDKQMAALRSALLRGHKPACPASPSR